jgi:hypothetical protein
MDCHDSQLIAEYRDENEEALAQQLTRLHLHTNASVPVVSFSPDCSLYAYKSGIA